MVRELANANFGFLFSSPVLEHVWSDAGVLNEQLRERILAYAESHPGEDHTNIGGWHSPVGTLEFCGSAGARLIRHMHAMTEEATNRFYAEHGQSAGRTSWILSAWANVNRLGDFNTTHTHPGATWSGVYYVDSGMSDPSKDGTAIQLTDPCPPRTNIFFPEVTSREVKFRPVPGLMILFPSYIPHAVPPHRGDRPRISIAFNVRKDPFP